MFHHFNIDKFPFFLGMLGHFFQLSFFLRCLLNRAENKSTWKKLTMPLCAPHRKVAEKNAVHTKCHPLRLRFELCQEIEVARRPTSLRLIKNTHGPALNRETDDKYSWKWKSLKFHCCRPRLDRAAATAAESPESAMRLFHFHKPTITSTMARQNCVHRWGRESTSEDGWVNVDNVQALCVC